MKMVQRFLWMQLLVASLLLLLSGCDPKALAPEADANASGHTSASTFTIAANKAVLTEMAAFDPIDFEQAQKGLIASDPQLQVKDKNGNTIFDQTAFNFIKGKAPASVNPSLWRQEKLNNIHGLFKVSDGIYQLRGHDLSNMTLIEGDTGWIIVDPLSSEETAQRALALARKEMGERAITGIIFTHSHVDHFGGILGIISAEQAATDKIPIIAPEGFMAEATSENVIAGVTMGRRTGFAYGKWLGINDRGHIGSGLGKTIPMGSMGILPPTIIIDRTPQAMQIDGVDFICQNVPDSEAPAELTFYLPKHKAFCGAELVSRNMHNIYTLRGAKVRDALAWSNYIHQALELFGDADIYFASHHWPIWGNEAITTFLKQQRDTYKYIHDQTLRLASHGATPGEIAEQIKLPQSLNNAASSRGYYGTLRHNARAVYQHYFGWFDANPVHLNPLPPVAASTRYVSAMGGIEQVITLAQQAYDEGEYRWTAELLNHAVFAEPSNKSARALLARCYDQMGYQAESGPWRDIYLSAALELRQGGTSETNLNLSNAKHLLEQTPFENLFDALATRLNGPKADGVNLTLNINFTDIDSYYVLWIENAVLHHKKSEPDPDANTTLHIDSELYTSIILGEVDIKQLLNSDKLSLEGSALDLIKFFSLLESPNMAFNIIEP
jgi:alkyl sulfatase BDS1-like metallo-beta-lactamase superfamily hydrolase